MSLPPAPDGYTQGERGWFSSLSQPLLLRIFNPLLHVGAVAVLPGLCNTDWELIKNPTQAESYCAETWKLEEVGCVS